MPDKQPGITLIMIGLLICAIVGLSLATTNPANAQCGSQASSCKNCHEVQGQDPVNNDGTEWHSAHAFGDFCYICHAGNNQVMDETEAHTGMVAPLYDIQASCQQCHPNDLEALAQVYADILGVDIGSGGPAASSTGAGGPTAGAVLLNPVSAPVGSELVIDDANLINFVQRYEEIVLGKKPVNPGNIILFVLIGLIALGGAGFILYYELYKKPKLQPVLQTNAYPADVIDLLPALSRLKPQSRKSLKGILENPQKTETAFKLIDTLLSDEESNEANL